MSSMMGAIAASRRQSSAPVETSYANAGGTGDRRSIIDVSMIGDIGGSGGPNSFVDGTIGNQIWWSGNGNQARDLVFDFGSPKVIDEARYYQSNASTNGTWQWQGSNDGSSWSNIGGPFALGGSGVSFSTPQLHVELHGNSVPFRFYKLHKPSNGDGGGQTSDSAWVSEIEFRIGP